MRRKIAKRKRREILAKGAEIVSERWVIDHDPEEKCFIVEVNYCGWNIHAPERDELAAYNAVLECFPDCEAEPFVRQ